MKIRAIITGVTGMVGEGVLHECLLHPDIESVLVINRKPCGVKHNKLKEIIHKDFFDLSSIKNQLAGHNACYFCAGVSSVGKKEDEYKRITYDLTLNFANTLVKLNPEMTFCYVSGVGTDSTEKGRSMWARVKGKTENDLMKLPFKAAYMFRPGYIQPTKGLKNSYKIYKVFTPFYPILKTLFPKYVVS
ncbi:MAG: NAD-dependent epimerase/dehydratase family protein, partial [Ignavibacteriales bacterium]